MEEKDELYKLLNKRLSIEEIISNGNKLLGALELGFSIGYSQGYNRALKDFTKTLQKK